MPFAFPFPYGPIAPMPSWQEPWHPNATYDGTRGNDEAYGGNGADVMYGDGGLDVLWGGGGNDKLFAASNSGSWQVGQGGYTPGVNLTALHGEDGNDRLTIEKGATGSFMLDGGWDSDTLIVRGGTDVLLIGGEHSDTFWFDDSFRGDGQAGTLDATIQDFDIGIDVVNGEGNILLTDASSPGGWAILHTHGGATVELQGITKDWAFEHINQILGY